MPIISQCPVTESFPAERSANRNAAEAARGDPGCDMSARKSERPQRWDSKGNPPRDVSDGVAALIAITGGIWQLANADRVHDNQNHA
jgi:hypothetical protein